ncbi:MAG: coenzyme F420-0:L-glutamate ligase, partial [Chloroflexia bacterium]|nr:coenzyme F420-0:L-glutamate ligase [Chloroflexia bacterium]
MRIIGIGGLPEVSPGDPLAELIGDALAAAGGLVAGDVVAVTHKIVSKAEGRLVDLRTVQPSALAERLAADFDKDARQVEVVLREATRIVRMVNGIIIAETAHGFVCANAGVDASNVAPETVCLLPRDPDASAEAIRAALTARFFPEAEEAEHPVGVIVTDSFGRPWRAGIVNVAIGVAGIAPLADYRGQRDAAGYELRASVLAVADELAAAAELVMHKLAARPVAIVRGYAWPTTGPA